MQPLNRVIVVLLATLVLGFVAAPALAAPLDDAKAAGYLGEQPDGYLGLVDPAAPAEVKRLMTDINDKRRTYYQGIAVKNGTSLEAVQALVGAKLIDQAPSGIHVKDSNGRWIRK